MDGSVGFDAITYGTFDVAEWVASTTSISEGIIMRLAIALLISMVLAAPAMAQQPHLKGTTASKPAGQPQKAQEKSQENKAPNPEQQQKLSEQEEVLRQRFLLREKFNKSWDVTAENAKDRHWTVSRCKNEARRQYSALRPIKRRTYMKECIARAGR
jgi:hypothetical protein